MNYMVIGPCIITFLLIANSLLVFAKNILYISILFTMLCSFRIRGWNMGLCFLSNVRALIFLGI